MKIRILLFALLFAIAAHSEETISLIFGGDAMVHSPQFQWAYNASNDTYDFEPNFRYIRPFLERADLAIVNFETTLAGKPYSGYPNFASPDSYLDALKNAGFDVFMMANNHVLDRGRRGMERTLDQETTPIWALIVRLKTARSVIRSLWKCKDFGLLSSTARMDAMVIKPSRLRMSISSIRLRLLPTCAVLKISK